MWNKVTRNAISSLAASIREATRAAATLGDTINRLDEEQTPDLAAMETQMQALEYQAALARQALNVAKAAAGIR